MSFLQQEPEVDRHNLQEAIAQSHVLSNSQSSSDDGLDQVATGVGDGLSLPGFVSDFLRSVGERLRVSIAGVTVDLNLDIDLPSTGTSDSQTSLGERVTTQLSIAEVHLEGVTTPIHYGGTSGVSAVDGIVSSLPEDQQDKTRQILLRNISGRLLLGTTAFAKLQYPFDSPSPRTFRSRSETTQEAFEDALDTSTDEAKIDSSMVDSSQIGSPSDEVDVAAGSLPDSDTLGKSSDLTDSISEQQERGYSVFDDFGIADEASRLPVDDMQPSGSFPGAFPRSADYARLDAHSLDRSRGPSGHSHPESIPFGGSSTEYSDKLPRYREDKDDLSQSKVFSHEEAESMYMSAISQAPLQEADVRRVSPIKPSLPGTWDYEYSEEQALEPHEETTSDKAVGEARSDPSDQDHDTQTSSENTMPKATSTSSSASSRRSSIQFQEPMQPSGTPIQDREGVDETSTISPEKSLDHSLIVKEVLILDEICLQIPHHDSGAASRRLSLGNFEIVGDLELTKLIILMLQRLLELSRPTPNANKPSNGKTKRASSFALFVRSLRWQFLDAIQGRAQPRPSSPSNEKRELAADAEVYLRAEIRGVRIKQSISENNSKTSIIFGKVSAGYGTSDILSFDSELKMRESVRDNLAPVDSDVAITISQSDALRQVDITSLPLSILLDLRKLDETFSWFGGFSSFLGLGNSIVSTVTLTDRSKNIPAPKTTRGVRFADASNRQIEKDGKASDPNKITIRLGGVVLDLQGSESSFRLESTALKLVSRAEIIGVQVDRLKFEGPRCYPATSQASLMSSLSNLRIEYLTTPKEVDLARLLGLLTPSKDKYGDDDDILLDTLLRQRRQGGVLRWTIDHAHCHLSTMDSIGQLQKVIKEMSALSSVAKYLPEDDRPGLLILGLLRNLDFSAYTNELFGDFSLATTNLDLAHVTFPGLMALSVGQIRCSRNHQQSLFEAALPVEARQRSPVIMLRFISNELEPTVKIKLQDLRVEYHVTVLMAMMGLQEGATAETLVADMADSVATIIDRKNSKPHSPAFVSQASWNSESSVGISSKSLAVDIALRDSVLGLNPYRTSSKGLLVITEAQIGGVLPKDEQSHMVMDVKRASFLAIDNVNNIQNLPSVPDLATSNQISEFNRMGFVTLTSVSAAKAEIKVLKADNASGRTIDLEVRDDLLVLETCADSTQTLQNIFNGLAPPMPPSSIPKYRTEVVNIEDMLASLTGDAFSRDEQDEDEDMRLSTELGESDMVEDDVPQNLEYVSSLYNPDPEGLQDSIADSMLEDDLENMTRLPEQKHIGDKPLLESFQEQCEVAPGGESLHFQDDYFAPKSDIQGTAHRWNTTQGTYELARNSKVSQSPLRIRVRDVHIIWNLFDGYDWQHTRETLGEAVAAVEAKANEKRARKRRSLQMEEDQESVIGDFLFNSIYIGVNANRDPRDLSRQINRDIDDLASETGTYTTSSTVKSPTRQSQSPRPRAPKLRLQRSKYHKMTFELKGLSADYVIFPQEKDETQSSLDVRVHDIEIFDHVPTSTWKKFATYMHDAGERESGSNMVHLEILTIKPVPDLSASEIIMKATVLPLRLHVDQDALDFMTRFFEFKDDSAVPSAPKEAAFIQRLEVNAIRVKLDFKPKRVDYVGLRSGRTTEFMNFFILDNAEMVLRRIILYGVSGFDRVSKSLNDIWMPDIRQNQLPGILAGLAPVRSLVNVGGGIRDLVVVPVREYRKDGRIVRSIQKGAFAFAKTTTTELVKLGAKLAIGTQTVLQGAEDLLAQPQYQDVSAGWEHATIDAEDEKKRISLYADQPVGVVQGLRSAYTSLERDLITAKDAIVAMPGEVMESGTATGAAKAVIRGAPTVILRPALGVSKAVGQTLMGTANTLDKQQRRRMEEKYKKH